MKKLLAAVLAVTMTFGAAALPMTESGVLPEQGISASAYTSHTQQEALDWVRSQVGKGIDYDGVNGNQCVDLIKAYYAYLGVSPVSGNGADYTWNNLPSGWSRIQNAQPQPGDILVYTSGYGHVAIYESDRVHYHQNFNSNSYVQCINYMYNKLSNPYWGVIRPDFNTHTHSYSSSITTQPTCTSAGVKTYRCSCGSTYTEAVPAKGHSYINTTVASTLTEKGYTIHTCSICGNSYKDSYTDAPELKSDGWYYCDILPTEIDSDQYTIQYNNCYEKIQSSSPGADWKNSGVAKNEWQNTGAQYTSNTDLSTSDSRVLVRSKYYHFCIPGTGKNSEGNYEMSGSFQHYDEVDPNYVTAKYIGDDNGHPYYLLYWADGNAVYCKSGDTCNGAWGTHDYRCKAWYKENTYQDRVKVTLYKFTKQSGWTSAKDTSASAVKKRFRLKKDNHSFTEWTITVPVTCTTDGIQTRTCLNCGEIETQIVAKTGHSYTTVKIVEPTYYADGYTIKKCSCGSEIKTDIIKKKVLGKTTAKTTFTATTNAVRVNWLKTPGATGYKIYRQDGKKWVEAGTVYNSDTTSFKVKGLKSGTTYKFRVKPFIKNGKKVTWGTASDTVTTSTVPAKAYIGHVAKSEKAIRFFWRKINAMGYQIQRYDYTAKKWKLIKTVRNNKTNNYRYIVPRKNTIYKFRIRAYTKVGKKTIFGKWSNSKIVMAK